MPAVASAEPNVDAAVAAFKDLGPHAADHDAERARRVADRRRPPRTSATARTTRSTRSWRTSRRPIPTLVTLKTAPRKSVEGRDDQVRRDHQRRRRNYDGKPVFFMMGAIHGDEWAAGEHTLEFVYDVINTSQDEPEGQGAARQGPHDRHPGRQRRRLGAQPPRELRRRTAAARRPTCAHHRRRHEPQLSVRLGLEHRRHVRRARLRPGLRARGPEHDGHRARTTRSSRWSRTTRTRTRSSTRAWRSRPASRADLRRHPRPLASRWPTRPTTATRTSATRRTTTRPAGETIDWSYYATRGFAVTFETVGGSSTCDRDSATNTAGSRRTTSTAPRPTTPASSPADGDRGHRRATTAATRSATRFYQSLVFATIAGGHSVINGTAPARARR